MLKPIIYSLGVVLTLSCLTGCAEEKGEPEVLVLTPQEAEPLPAEEVDIPASIVELFYAAAASNDCETALRLRPDYSLSRCEKLSDATIHKVKTLQQDTYSAEVGLDISVYAAGTVQNFNGTVFMRMQGDDWILDKYESSPKGKSVFDQVEAVVPNDEITADPLPVLARLQASYPRHAQQSMVLVDVDKQVLSIYRGQEKLAEFPVSTATKGIGNRAGSDKTPLGVHRISHKFGDNAEKGTIFKARQNTGQVAEIITEKRDVPEDHVTTRILWLDGLEEGKNKGGNVDSQNRYIYIHGTPEEGLIGQPASHGCIRMLNDDVMRVYDMLDVDSLVYIGR